MGKKQLHYNRNRKYINYEIITREKKNITINRLRRRWIMTLYNILCWAAVRGTPYNNNNNVYY